MNLSGNTILITGGSVGIGLILAESFVNLGNEVIICGRREKRLQEAKEKVPALHTRVCDVSDLNQLKELYEWVVKSFPETNVLINNAGIQRDIDLTAGLDEILGGDSEIRIDLEAPIYLSSLFIPYFMNKNNTAIINVTSGLAYSPLPQMPVYCACKAALHTYTLLLRHQLSDKGIEVIEVIPPMVDTELNSEGRTKRNLKYRGIDTQEYVSSVINGLKEGQTEVYYDQRLEIKTASREVIERKLLFKVD